MTQLQQRKRRTHERQPPRRATKPRRAAELSLVVPVRHCRRDRGRLDLAGTVTLASGLSDDALPLEQLGQELAEVGVRARITMGAAAATVELRRDRALGHPERYRLTIARDGIEIVSAAAAGAYYAVQTLRDLVRLNGRRLPCCQIDDGPTFQRRAVYHDCARGKVPTVQTIQQLIEWLAHWKINELQLYIENAFTFAKHPAIGKGFSPYRPDDILAMQAHARKHHVRFVPSLTSFGHFEKILMVPGYEKLGELPGSRGMPGGTVLCPGDPGSIQLLADMYGEFLPLFEAEDFNACADEPWELGEGRSKRRAQRVGVARVYVDFICELRKLAERHGKRLNIWGEIVMKRPEALTMLPGDICLLNWQYGRAHDRIDRCNELRDHGFAYVGCSGTSSAATHGSRLEYALLNVARFATVVRKNGGEGLLHTDWGNVGHRHYLATSLCSMAHAAAHAWLNEKVDDDTHVRRFTNLVYGDPDGAFADALQRLGQSDIRGYSPYFALLEKLEKPERLVRGGHIFDGFREDRIITLDNSQAAPETVAGRADDVRALEWPTPARPLSPFLAPTLDEFRSAARMEAAGCERIRLARDMRAGRPASAQDLRRHAEDLDRCAVEHERLWRLRNRPSRLRDNLAVFRAGVKEARRLAKKQPLEGATR